MANQQDPTNFASLGFGDEPVPVDYANVPEQFDRLPIPQPGPGYIFQLPPMSLVDGIWVRTLDDKGAPRLEVRFAGGKELRIYYDPSGALTGQAFRWRVNNIERGWNPENPEAKSSRMVYLLKDGLRGADLSNASNQQYALELIAHSGELFGATVTWNARCNPDNDVYKFDATTQQGEKLSGVKGCGQRYAQRQRKNRKTGEETKVIQRAENGAWMEEFVCVTPNCGAYLRCFADLETFRFVEGQQGQGQAQAASA